MMEKAEVEKVDLVVSGPKTFVKERLRLEDGELIDWYYVDTQPSVMVLPVTGDGQVLLVSQYRHNLRCHTTELPAGNVNPQESPAAAALRELTEETGYTVDSQSDLVPLGEFYSLPSETNKVIHYFVAKNVRFQGAPTGDTEIEKYFDMKIVKMAFADAVRRIGAEIRGSETSFALILARENNVLE